MGNKILYVTKREKQREDSYILSQIFQLYYIKHCNLY